MVSLLAERLRTEYHRTGFTDFLQHAKIHYVVSGQPAEAMETEQELMRRTGWLSDLQSTEMPELETEFNQHRRKAYEFIHRHLAEFVRIPIFSYRRKAFSLQEILGRLKKNKPLEKLDELELNKQKKRIREARSTANRKVEFVTVRQMLDQYEDAGITHFALTKKEDLQRCLLEFMKSKMKKQSKGFQNQVRKELQEWTDPSLVSTFLHAIWEHMQHPTS